MSDFSKLNGFNVKDKEARAMFDYLHTIFAEDILKNGKFVYDSEEGRYTNWVIRDVNGAEFFPYNNVENGITVEAAFIDQEITPTYKYNTVALCIGSLFIESPSLSPVKIKFAFGGGVETEGILAGNTYNDEATHLFECNKEYNNVIVTLGFGGEKPTDSNYKFRIDTSDLSDVQITIKDLKLFCYDNPNTTRYNSETFEERRMYTGDMG